MKVHSEKKIKTFFSDKVEMQCIDFTKILFFFALSQPPEKIGLKFCQAVYMPVESFASNYMPFPNGQKVSSQNFQLALLVI